MRRVRPYRRLLDLAAPHSAFRNRSTRTLPSVRECAFTSKAQRERKRVAGLQQRRALRGPRRLQVRPVGQRLQGRQGGRREAAVPQAQRGSAADGVDGVRLLRPDMRAGTVGEAKQGCLTSRIACSFGFVVVFFTTPL